MAVDQKKDRVQAGSRISVDKRRLFRVEHGSTMQRRMEKFLISSPGLPLLLRRPFVPHGEDDTLCRSPNTCRDVRYSREFQLSSPFLSRFFVIFAILSHREVYRWL